MIRERVLAILAEQARLPVEALDLSLPAAAQGLDSVAMLEAIFAIEEAFDQPLAYGAEEAPRNLGEVVAMIEARLTP